MPDVSFRPGCFCWFELATSDQAGARAFYTALLGWAVHEFPLGPGEVYTTFRLRGRDVGAAYTLHEEQRKQGVPPHWMTYVGVSSADDAAARAASLGATVIAPAFDVYDFGRMAVIQDATGAHLSLWQAKTHPGVGVHGEQGAFCWSELLTRDTAAAARFYTGLFGWTTKTDQGQTPYTEWKLDGQPIGGMLSIQPEWGEVPPHWMNYVSVADCDATAARAKELGGKVLAGPMDVPNVGRSAALQDPQGAAFSVIHLTHL
jgi:hypothetical protein